MTKTPKKTRRSKIDSDIIKDYYKREDVSRLVPQKRYATKDGPGYLMQISVRSACEKFNSENPYGKVSLGKFAAVRPKNVRKLNMKHREFCVCVYCMNIRYKMLTLSRATKDLSKKKTNEKDLIDILLCPKSDNDFFHQPCCLKGTCKICGSSYLDTLNSYYVDIDEDKLLTWSRWEKVEIVLKSNLFSKKQLLTKTGVKKQLLEEMVQKDVNKPVQGCSFIKHYHTAIWQLRQFQSLKNNLPKDWMLSIMDFAKNRSTINQDEIKAAFYTQGQITLHPIVTYHKGEKGLCRYSTIIISDDSNHDYHAVKHYSTLADEHLEDKIGIKPIRKVVFSDGCSSQYKSKGPFSDISLSSDVRLDRNYYGSEHGKGECDGEIGILNRAVDRAIIGRKVIINNSRDMFNYCIENLQLNEQMSKRTFLLVKEEDVNRNRPETQVKTVPGTRSFQQILNIPGQEYKIMVRNLSCFCSRCMDGHFESCLNSLYVDKFQTKSLQCQNDVTSFQMQEENPAAEQKSSKMTDPSVGNRKDYFQKRIRMLQRAESFESLKMILAGLNTNTVDEFENIPIYEARSFLNARLTIDANSKDLVPDDIPLKTKDLYPAAIYGDGNCLPRSGSVIVFGDQDNHEEVRFRIVRELAENEDFYLDARDPLVNKTFASFSDCYTRGRLTRKTVRSIYEKETLCGTKPGAYMGMWQLSALCSVLDRPLVSVCPKYGNFNVRSDIQRVFYPRGSEEPVTGMNNDAVFIMWTNTNGMNLPESSFTLNHFVYLLPMVSDGDEYPEDNFSDISSICSGVMDNSFSEVISTILLENITEDVKEPISDLVMEDNEDMPKDYKLKDCTEKVLQDCVEANQAHLPFAQTSCLDTDLSDGDEPVLSDGAEPVLSDGAKTVLSDGAEPVLSDGAKTVLSDGAEPVLSDGADPVLSDGAEPVLSDVAEPVLSDGAEPVLSDVAKTVLSDGAEPVLSDGADPVLSDVAKTVLSDGAEPVLSDVARTVLSDGAEPVLSDGAEPVLSDVAKTVLSDGAEPVLSDGADPVLSDGAEPVLSDVAEPVLSDGAEKLLNNGAEPVLSDAAVTLLCDGPEPVLSDCAQTSLPVGEKMNISDDLSRYRVGAYIIAKCGKENIPCLVVQTPADMEPMPDIGVWVQYLKKARASLWSLEDKPFFLEFGNILRCLESPSLTAAGTRIYYKFE